MIKNILYSATIIILLGSFSPVVAQKAKQVSATVAKNDVKFLEDISIEIPASQSAPDPKAVISEPIFATKKITSAPSSSPAIENAAALQFKYALLLDMEVEQVKNLNLFKIIDEWLGTRYKLGGSTKEGIDCSAFMQVLFTAFYSFSLPRTAREQFNFTRKISRTELKEGDLVFFNTIGGVSHVGMYLQNNKFVHASSGGVTISDLYEDYWMRRYVGVGRISNIHQITALTSNP